MRYKLRDYQHKAVERAREGIAAGRRRPLIVAPTGSGKTVIACAIVEGAARKENRTLFVAHRMELIQQVSAKLDEIGIDHGIIKAGHPRVRPRLPVQVGSVQTLARRIGKANSPEEPYRLIIVDEAHHVTASSYKAVLDASPGAVVLGLTATPYRADGTALGDVFNDLVEVTTLADLIESGHLVEPRVFARAMPDLSGVRRVGNDYNIGQLAQVMDCAELVDDIVDAWRQKAEGRLTVAFAVSIKHSQHIAEAFNRVGVAAGHVDGEMPAAERAAVLARLASGELRVVANCAILTEGWDMPQCSCVILARPTQSRSLWKQMCGRALRPAPEVGKVDCLILDHSGCYRRFGFLPDPEEHSLRGREKAHHEGGFHCPFCSEELLGWPKYCPVCEEELPRGGKHAAGPAVGEMAELKPAEEQVRFYQELARRARERNHRPGSIAVEFRNRYGHGPRRIHMGDDPMLLTRWDEELRERVWVHELEPRD
ncbi:DEAD/DEAH box helicase [Sorangium sp. So ce1182]|uniref:DEAD/DEAH box helicase n=1 Tax=Sorangium sp. So ce1182 TaxID=3133334 RepID=UPI003F62FEF6